MSLLLSAQLRQTLWVSLMATRRGSLSKPAAYWSGSISIPGLPSWNFMFALLAPCSGAEIAAQAAAPITMTVTITGNVSQSLALTVADLKRYPAHHI